MASAASRAASLRSPAALCADPLALSILPSVSMSLSPLSLPAPSLMAPFALSAAPFTCSRSMIVFLCCLETVQQKSHAVVPRRASADLCTGLLSLALRDVPRCLTRVGCAQQSKRHEIAHLDHQDQPAIDIF